jgi:hypothetical protein
VNERPNYNLDKIKMSSDEYINPAGPNTATIQSEIAAHDNQRHCCDAAGGAVRINQWGPPGYTPNGYET